MGRVHPCGRPLMVGSWDRDRCVFTMQVPSLESSASASIALSFSCASGRVGHAVRSVDLGRDQPDPLRQRAWKARRGT